MRWNIQTCEFMEFVDLNGVSSRFGMIWYEYIIYTVYIYILLYINILQNAVCWPGFIKNNSTVSDLEGQTQLSQSGIILGSAAAIFGVHSLKVFRSKHQSHKKSSKKNAKKKKLRFSDLFKAAADRWCFRKRWRQGILNSSKFAVEEICPETQTTWFTENS